MLLCLAGGFPPHPICTAAHAVMIARITPWPIEPPVQPWNCPMAARGPVPLTPLARSMKVTKGEDFGEKPSSTLPRPAALRSVLRTPNVRLWPAGFADPTYDYVRTIEVWHVNYRRAYRGGERDDCQISDDTRLGNDDELSFAWKRAARRGVPTAMRTPLSSDCTTVAQRGVGMMYEDYQCRVTSSYFR